MFLSATLPQNLSKKEFKALEPELRTELLEAQLELIEERKFSVVVVIAGVDGAGKSEALARLYEWMDPRHLICNAYDVPTEDESQRPPYWRFWRDLPQRGDISVVISSWYQEPMRNLVMGRSDEDEFERELNKIARFEEMLAEDGVLILKLWFSLSPEDQKKRLKAIEGTHRRKRHLLEEWTNQKNCERAQEVIEKVTLRTSTLVAPWFVIPSKDREYRDLALGQILREALRNRLSQEKAHVRAQPAVIGGVLRQFAISAIDLDQTISKSDYSKELEHWQNELARLSDKKSFRDVSLICAFEGNDAAGKGGAIRRVITALDPRLYRVHPIAAPTEDELAHPYLWRFWNRLPPKGRAAFFDRSWYGRVLVERVEGFCSEADWLRAYNEINNFEADLDAFGAVVCKFWLAISEEEQLARFRARKDTEYKQFKITDEDWRNRLKWDDYAHAAADMVDRTSTSYAPWTLVAAEDKKFARVQVLKTICKQLKKAL